MTRREQRKKKQRVRRIVIWSIVIVAVLVSGFAFIRARSANGANGVAALAGERRYTVRMVSDRDTVEVSGNVEALAARDHSFATVRELVGVSVEVGDTVAIGQELARVDDTQERFNLADLDLTIEETRLTGSQRQLAVLELQRALLVDALEDTILRAQIAGTVVEVNAEVGERVDAGTSVIRVIDTGALVADVEVNEYDLPLLEVGMPVEFTFDAVPDEVYMGTLSELALEGRVNTQGLAVIDGQIRLDEPDPRIVPSYSFLAEIIVSETDAVLAVEQAALFEGPRSTIAMVIGESGDPEPTPVEVEELGDGLVRVVSGLDEGAELADPTALQAGQNSGQQESGGPNVRVIPGGGGRGGGGGGGGRL